MRILTNMRACGSAPKRHVCVCLLLVFLLFYNPYIMASGSVGGLNMTHPASNRATVGSSELQHFTSVAGQDLIAFADFAPTEAFYLLPTLAGLDFFGVSLELGPSQQVLCASLWFRPPPAS